MDVETICTRKIFRIDKRYAAIQQASAEAEHGDNYVSGAINLSDWPGAAQKKVFDWLALFGQSMSMQRPSRETLGCNSGKIKRPLDLVYRKSIRGLPSWCCHHALNDGPNMKILADDRVRHVGVAYTSCENCPSW